jgi:4-hydroxy-L-threonine phosphate dehydrogenase PdxA
LGFWGRANISLGFPIICTYVGYGTAFNVAVEGDVNPINLINAIQYTSEMHSSCSNVCPYTGS